MIRETTTQRVPHFSRPLREVGIWSFADREADTTVEELRCSAAQRTENERGL
jgi:hypothetical protein